MIVLLDLFKSVTLFLFHIFKISLFFPYCYFNRDGEMTLHFKSAIGRFFFKKTLNSLQYNKEITYFGWTCPVPPFGACLLFFLKGANMQISAALFSESTL